MKTPPESFNEKIYEETRDIIHKNTDRFKPDAYDVLNQIAGGSALFAARNPLQFPPCLEESKCDSCWVQKWCVHNKTPSDIRVALQQALNVFATPGLKMHKRAVEKIKTLNKTETASIDTILAIAQYYRKHSELIEKEVKEDDTPKDV